MHESLQLPESEVPVLGLKTNAAAKALGISRTTLWRVTESGKVRKTGNGIYPVPELQRFLASEIGDKPKRSSCRS